MARLTAVSFALVLLLGAAPAWGDPAGRTTLEETLGPAPADGFAPLVRQSGEAYVVRRGGSASARAQRKNKRRSLLMFAQVTDPQIVDEMSPARVDFADPAGGEIKSSWRPQETMGLQIFDQTVRNINANRTSTVRQGNGKRARLRLAITTGDLADNQQLNETRWFKTVLDGGAVDPFSGKVVGPGNPCGAPADEVAAANADVAARNYTGVADYDDYRSAPQDRFAGFWDPDEAAPTPGPYSAFPRYPGLNEAAQRPFTAAGLDVPWFISRGNHDGLVQGNAPASEDLFRAIAVGCLKVFPNAQFDPERFEGASDDELFASFADTTFIQQLLAGGRTVAPDPDRRIISKLEYRRAIGTSKEHGFGYTKRSELTRSRGTASYYAWTPRRGFRFVSLDTVAEGGGQSGNLDDAQYRWLRRAGRRDQLVVAFGHHTLGTMTNTRPDERAGKCATADEPGCDRDPRRSKPLHLGKKGKRTVRALFAGSPNVVAYVAGHTHANRVDFNRGRNGRGCWEINTASHIDWPQQSRLIEVMDNRDGTLSLFGTLLDQAAPAAAPPPGPAIGMTPEQLASLGRTLAYNDPQREGLEGSEGDAEKSGRRVDRNVELLVRDPRSAASQRPLDRTGPTRVEGCPSGIRSGRAVDAAARMCRG
jgi:metallophosphoesterase (TIGR03767 family)